MIQIQPTAHGCTLTIRVTPKAKRAAIGGAHDGALKVAVTVVPEDGKANKAVIAAISKRLGVSKSSIEIINGQTNRVKTLSIAGIQPAELREMLADCIN
ncbi:hypothetical protein SAMN06265222_103273 [Neorhodopirellula lusitana]|uniref:UPF0235 protein SAMN06265222_103273 n=1 Tax=Neorhodopirellula lusitana TaxID=445327 RepID=A0ABY1PWL7_9BACT|nr:DUF167 domain-containing protein [Neorhodopirellula lusitana]SMP51444.1 hypothetical protein SAMN06265222_103273 [Neorhodopirellula lusitana]